MRIRLLWTLATLPLLPTAEGVEQDSISETQVFNVFDSVQTAFQKLESIDIESISQVSELPIFRETNQSSVQTGGRTASISLQARGRKYRYNKILTEFDGSGSRSKEYAFDEKNYQYLNANLGSLIITRFDVEKSHFDLAIFNPLSQFDFLRGFLPAKERSIAFDTLKNAGILKSCFVGARFLRDEKLDGDPCVVLQFDGGINYYLNVPCDYVVYFSRAHGFFPIAWKSIDKKGRVLLDYRITEIGNCPLAGKTTFYYPKKATTREFTTAKYPADQPQVIVETTISSIKINSIDTDDIFTIDPLKAKEVVDLDNNVAIPIPK